MIGTGSPCDVCVGVVIHRQDDLTAASGFHPRVRIGRFGCRDRSARSASMRRASPTRSAGRASGHSRRSAAAASARSGPCRDCARRSRRARRGRRRRRRPRPVRSARSRPASGWRGRNSRAGPGTPIASRARRRSSGRNELCSPTTRSYHPARSACARWLRTNGALAGTARTMRRSSRCRGCATICPRKCLLLQFYHGMARVFRGRDLLLRTYEACH